MAQWVKSAIMLLAALPCLGSCASPQDVHASSITASTEPCAGAAENDPAWREVMLQSLGSPNGPDKAASAAQAARDRAQVDCRRRAGLPRAGSGVEARPARETLY